MSTPNFRVPGNDEASLSDADLWEKKVRDGFPKDQATRYVQQRKMHAAPTVAEPQTGKLGAVASSLVAATLDAQAPQRIRSREALVI